MVDLDEIERLEKAASKAPWDGSPANPDRQFCAQVWDDDGKDLATLDPTVQATADAALIVRLRNAAPALIREVRELRERVALMEQSTPARILMTCKKCGHKWMAIWNTEACPKCVFKCECGNSKPYNLRACKTCLDKAALSPDMGEGG